MRILSPWHENSESMSLKLITPAGYKCVDAARPMTPVQAHTVDLQNYGGLALVYRDCVTVTRLTLDTSPTTFEYLYVSVTSGKDSILLLGIYRPGSQAVTLEFFNELTAVLEQVSIQRRPFVICGDVNVHVNDNDDVHATRFNDLLQTFDCVQHVREPTHRAGHTLDVVISRADTDLRRLSVGDFLSDHAVVNFKLSLRRPASMPQPVMRRRWRSFIAADFEADLSSSRLCTGLDNLDQLSADELMEMYDSEMLLLLDENCSEAEAV